MQVRWWINERESERERSINHRILQLPTLRIKNFWRCMCWSNNRKLVFQEFYEKPPVVDATNVKNLSISSTSITQILMSMWCCSCLLNYIPVQDNVLGRNECFFFHCKGEGRPAWNRLVDNAYFQITFRVHFKFIWGAGFQVHPQQLCCTFL